MARHPERPDLLIVKRAARREPGGWWLASDNPAAGAVDSRAFGAVPPSLIEGRMLVRYRRGRPVAPERPEAPSRTGWGLRSGQRLCLSGPAGSTASPDCRATRFSISSLGSRAAIAQK